MWYSQWFRSRCVAKWYFQMGLLHLSLISLHHQMLWELDMQRNNNGRSCKPYDTFSHKLCTVYLKSDLLASPGKRIDRTKRCCMYLIYCAKINVILTGQHIIWLRKLSNICWCAFKLRLVSVENLLMAWQSLLHCSRSWHTSQGCCAVSTSHLTARAYAPCTEGPNL